MPNLFKRKFTWKIGISPSDEFISPMLINTYELIPSESHPMIHSDIKIMK